MEDLGMTKRQEELFHAGELLTLEEATEITGLERRELLISPIARVRTSKGEPLFERESLYQCARNSDSDY